jgi:hypothetical protein
MIKVAYFSCQMPYPATHGGLVDDWARLNAMKAAGADLALVTWYAEQGQGLPKEHVQALRTVASVVHTLPITGTWADRFKRLMRLVRWPSHVASRIPSVQAQREIWTSLDKFKPQAIWLDAIYPIWMAQAAAKRYGVPIFYRSHNIEHRYMRGQVNRATTFRDRVAWSMNLPHLQRVEFDAWRQAELVFDISMDDLAWWRQQGFHQGVWLPPLVQPDKARQLSAPMLQAPAFDVAYLGNLRTPNNVEGLLWFLREVWPLVRRDRAGASMLLAGSAPVPSILEAVASAGGVVLRANPPDVIPVLRDASVLVNPIFGGSGVNVKSVEMLFAPGRLVSSPQGVAGLPDQVRGWFAVAQDARTFADAVLQAIAGGALQGRDLDERQGARDQFDFKRAVEVLRLMSDRCGDRSPAAATSSRRQ